MAQLSPQESFDWSRKDDRTAEGLVTFTFFYSHYQTQIFVFRGWVLKNQRSLGRGIRILSRKSKFATLLTTVILG